MKDEHNIFVHDFKPRKESKGKVKGRKRGKIKSKTTLRVGGRRVSAAPINKTQYKFPVEVSYK
jgi:hypothetical protein